jgi:hypothetical protein
MEFPACTREHILWWYINNDIRTFMKTACSAWKTFDFKVWMFRNIWIYLQCVVSINTGKSYFCTDSCLKFTSTHLINCSSRLAVHNYGKFHYPTYSTRTVITKLWRFLSSKQNPVITALVSSLLGYSSRFSGPVPILWVFKRFVQTCSKS